MELRLYLTNRRNMSHPCQDHSRTLNAHSPPKDSPFFSGCDWYDGFFIHSYGDLAGCGREVTDAVIIGVGDTGAPPLPLGPRPPPPPPASRLNWPNCGPTAPEGEPG